MRRKILNAILFRTIVVLFISVTASLAMAAGVYDYFNIPDPMTAMIMALICPSGISVPVSVYFFRQRQKFDQLWAKLALANQDLLDANARLAELASRDSLTRLVNRASFFEAVAPLCETTGGAMLVIDADHFKVVNEPYGHASGDMALMSIAAAIVGIAPKDSRVARLGGEEFAVFFPTTSGREATSIAEAVRRAAEEKMPAALKG